MVAKQVRAAYTQEFRLEAVRLVQSGQSQMQVCQTLGIPKASLGSWVRQAKVGTLKLGVADGAANKVTPEQMELARQAGRECNRKKSGGVLRAGRAARYAWIEQMKNVYPIAVSCHVLQVSSSGYFRFRRSGGEVSNLCSDELALAHIRAIHAEVKGEYGWPRMYKELQARGLRIGKERVRKLMVGHGIRAKTKRKFIVTTDSKHSLPVVPDLVQRRFTPQAPNRHHLYRYG